VETQEYSSHVISVRNYTRARSRWSWTCRGCLYDGWDFHKWRQACAHTDSIRSIVYVVVRLTRAIEIYPHPLVPRRYLPDDRPIRKCLTHIVRTAEPGEQNSMIFDHTTTMSGLSSAIGFTSRVYHNCSNKDLFGAIVFHMILSRLIARMGCL